MRLEIRWMQTRCNDSYFLPVSGIGAVFSVDTNGNVFFDGTAAGSSCSDAMAQGTIRRGDVLVAVEGIAVRQSTLGKISQQLLGPPNTTVQMTIRRDGRNSTVTLERRRTERVAMERAMEEAYERAKSTSIDPSPLRTADGPPGSRLGPGVSPAQNKGVGGLVGPAMPGARGGPTGGPSSSVWA
jgi:hypothetical protein